MRADLSAGFQPQVKGVLAQRIHTGQIGIPLGVNRVGAQTLVRVVDPRAGAPAGARKVQAVELIERQLEGVGALTDAVVVGQ